MKTIVTGGTGLVGHHLQKIFPEAVYLSRSDYDLSREDAVKALYHDLQPDRVIHMAAKVGGIVTNMQYPSDYLEENIVMNTFMVREAVRAGVTRFTGILSTCIYPDKVERYPLTEDQLHLGPPPAQNFSYAYAKRCMAVHIDAVNHQHGLAYNYVIPCNLFGVGDKHGNDSHFVTALIKKIWTAKRDGVGHIQLMGDGTPLRQYMDAGDLAWALKAMVDRDITSSFNVATHEVLSIRAIAELALAVCGAEDLEIRWDTSLPTGQHRKDASQQRLLELLPDFQAQSMAQALRRVYDQFST